MKARNNIVGLAVLIILIACMGYHIIHFFGTTAHDIWTIHDHSTPSMTLYFLRYLAMYGMNQCFKIRPCRVIWGLCLRYATLPLHSNWNWLAIFWYGIAKHWSATPYLGLSWFLDAAIIIIRQLWPQSRLGRIRSQSSLLSNEASWIHKQRTKFCFPYPTMEM